uniref:Acetyl-CoA hydrolase/transferase C-terminal domain-containing protein n=1 Tax=Ditylenchus dipsaci TaxID=166011 RepID=A0A915E5T3_9BILA
MPRTFGDGVIHQSQIDVLVYHDFPLHLQKLVDNGATLQMGIGAVPDAALAALKNHKDLGIHTEMFSDGILPLLECNAITNAKKFIIRVVMWSLLCMALRSCTSFYTTIFVYFGDVQWVNDPAVVRQNPKVTAINSAVEVDLTGQVVADSIGHRFISGFGGQVDFIRGAAIGNDGLGKPIIALPSTAKKGGQSKIVPFIQQGSGVVTSRAHVHYVVTEHGIAQLWGKTCANVLTK